MYRFINRLTETSPTKFGYLSNLSYIPVYKKIKVMALWEFKNLNKHGNYRSRIIHTKGALSIPGDGFGPSIFANRFKYEYKHPLIPPMVLELNGKTYLMPLWKEVVGGTTVDDIEWVKPKIKTKEKQKNIIIKSSSSSSDKIYTTTFYPDSGKFYCDCPGRWRASDSRCKHIKALELKTNK